MREILIPCSSESWQAEIDQAQAIDRECFVKYGQRDRDHHLCSVQRSQQMRGYTEAQITTNRYGFCVRDTMNDGLGNLSGNGTAEWAVEFARKWQSDVPGKRKVIVGYIADDQLPAFAAAKASLFALN
jgi:hypothetical protein